MTEETPPEPRPPSQVPSWIMLGFVLGVLVMFGWQRERPRVPDEPTAGPAIVELKPAPPANPATAVNELRIEDQPSLSIVEALFEQYRPYAFWEDDRTEIGVWNTRTLAFSDLFEVVRTDTGTYYRSIPSLTRLPVENYGPPGSPLLFTESTTQRAARYLKARGQVPRTLPPPPAPPVLPRVQPLPSEGP
jgi:hypothetical protein